MERKSAPTAGSRKECASYGERVRRRGASGERERAGGERVGKERSVGRERLRERVRTREERLREGNTGNSELFCTCQKLYTKTFRYISLRRE